MNTAELGLPACLSSDLFHPSPRSLLLHAVSAHIRAQTHMIFPCRQRDTPPPPLTTCCLPLLTVVTFQPSRLNPTPLATHALSGLTYIVFSAHAGLDSKCRLQAVYYLSCYLRSFDSFTSATPGDNVTCCDLVHPFLSRIF